MIATLVPLVAALTAVLFAPLPTHAQSAAAFDASTAPITVMSGAFTTLTILDADTSVTIGPSVTATTLEFTRSTPTKKCSGHVNITGGSFGSVVWKTEVDGGSILFDAVTVSGGIDFQQALTNVSSLQIQRAAVSISGPGHSEAVSFRMPINNVGELSIIGSTISATSPDAGAFSVRFHGAVTTQNISVLNITSNTIRCTGHAPARCVHWNGGAVTGGSFQFNNNSVSAQATGGCCAYPLITKLDGVMVFEAVGNNVVSEVTGGCCHRAFIVGGTRAERGLIAKNEVRLIGPALGTSESDLLYLGDLTDGHWELVGNNMLSTGTTFDAQVVGIDSISNATLNMSDNVVISEATAPHAANWVLNVLGACVDGGLHVARNTFITTGAEWNGHVRIPPLGSTRCRYTIDSNIFAGDERSPLNVSGPLIDTTVKILNQVNITNITFGEIVGGSVVLDGVDVSDGVLFSNITNASTISIVRSTIVNMTEAIDAHGVNFAAAVTNVTNLSITESSITTTCETGGAFSIRFHAPTTQIKLLNISGNTMVTNAQAPARSVHWHNNAFVSGGSFLFNNNTVSARAKGCCAYSLISSLQGLDVFEAIGNNLTSQASGGCCHRSIILYAGGTRVRRGLVKSNTVFNIAFPTATQRSEFLSVSPVGGEWEVSDNTALTEHTTYESQVLDIPLLHNATLKIDRNHFTTQATTHHSTNAFVFMGGQCIGGTVVIEGNTFLDNGPHPLAFVKTPALGALDYHFKIAANHFIGRNEALEFPKLTNTNVTIVDQGNIRNISFGDDSTAHFSGAVVLDNVTVDSSISFPTVTNSDVLMKGLTILNGNVTFFGPFSNSRRFVVASSVLTWDVGAGNPSDLDRYARSIGFLGGVDNLPLVQIVDTVINLNCTTCGGFAVRFESSVNDVGNIVFENVSAHVGAFAPARVIHFNCPVSNTASVAVSKSRLYAAAQVECCAYPLRFEKEVTKVRDITFEENDVYSTAFGYARGVGFERGLNETDRVVIARNTARFENFLWAQYPTELVYFDGTSVVTDVKVFVVANNTLRSETSYSTAGVLKLGPGVVAHRSRFEIFGNVHVHTNTTLATSPTAVSIQLGKSLSDVTVLIIRNNITRDQGIGFLQFGNLSNTSMFIADNVFATSNTSATPMPLVAPPVGDRVVDTVTTSFTFRCNALNGAALSSAVISAALPAGVRTSVLPCGRCVWSSDCATERTVRNFTFTDDPSVFPVTSASSVVEQSCGCRCLDRSFTRAAPALQCLGPSADTASDTLSLTRTAATKSPSKSSQLPVTATPSLHQTSSVVVDASSSSSTSGSEIMSGRSSGGSRPSAGASSSADPGSSASARRSSAPSATSPSSGLSGAASSSHLSGSTSGPSASSGMSSDARSSKSHVRLSSSRAGSTASPSSLSSGSRVGSASKATSTGGVTPVPETVSSSSSRTRSKSTASSSNSNSNANSSNSTGGGVHAAANDDDGGVSTGTIIGAMVGAAVLITIIAAIVAGLVAFGCCAALCRKKSHGDEEDEREMGMLSVANAKPAKYTWMQRANEIAKDLKNEGVHTTRDTGDGQQVDDEDTSETTGVDVLLPLERGGRRPQAPSAAPPLMMQQHHQHQDGILASGAAGSVPPPAVAALSMGATAHQQTHCGVLAGGHRTSTEPMAPPGRAKAQRHNPLDRSRASALNDSGAGRVGSGSNALGEQAAIDALLDSDFEEDGAVNARSAQDTSTRPPLSSPAPLMSDDDDFDL